MAPLRPPIRRPCPDPGLIDPATGPTSWCSGCQKTVHNLDHVAGDTVRDLVLAGGACVRYSARAAVVVLAIAIASDGADAHAPKTADPEVSQDGPGSRDEATTGTLIVRVTDDQGIELPGVKVAVTPVTGVLARGDEAPGAGSRHRRAARSLQPTTDRLGRVEFVLGEGEWGLTAWREEFQTAFVEGIRIVRGQSVTVVVQVLPGEFLYEGGI